MTSLPRRALSQEAVLAGWVLAIIRAMEVEGIPFNSIVEQADIDPLILQSGRNRYSQEEVSRLWQVAKTQTQNPAFGLTVARQVRPATFHVVGHSMSCSVSLYRALQRFARYCRLISDAATATLTQRGDTVVLEFYFDMGKKPPIYQSFDTVLSSVVYFLRWIAGKPLKLLKLCLRHQGPKLDQRFYDFFDCPIEYGAAQDSLHFSRKDLDRPILAADEEVAAMLDDIANRDLETRMEGRFTVRVRDALVAQLTTGAPTKEQTARMLHLTERTLLRRLKEEGLTYLTVLNQLREELAFQYIRRGDMDLSEVATRLGFSDYGAFSRAFARWTGIRPSSVSKVDSTFAEE